jgi:dTMP kinase
VSTHPIRGSFITLEGGDGSGKSTQAVALTDLIRREGYQALLTSEPDGTNLGQTIRAIFERPTESASPLAELLLFEAARAQHVDEVIRPALDDGTVVVCDRFADSTIAYQGYGRGLDVDMVRACNQIAAGELAPDLTLMFDLTVEAGLARAWTAQTGTPGPPRRTDYIGHDSLEFHRRVRAGFKEIAEREPLRIKVLDAGLPPQEVTAAAWKCVKELLDRCD